MFLDPIPLLRALRSLLDGMWGVLKGSWRGAGFVASLEAAAKRVVGGTGAKTVVAGVLACTDAGAKHAVGKRVRDVRPGAFMVGW